MQKQTKQKIFDKYDPANPPREMTLFGGAEYHAKKMDVQETWRKYGWKPKRETK
jgi:hypothetical protein